jgi:hypothetical protein
VCLLPIHRVEPRVQISVAQMAVTGIVPPYDFLAAGMGRRDSELW